MKLKALTTAIDLIPSSLHPPAAAAGGGWPACLRRCCCRVNVTLFSRVTLIRKPQSTSDVDHFHARELPCSRAKSRDGPISRRRGDSGLPYSFIYRDTHRGIRR